MKKIAFVLSILLFFSFSCNDTRDTEVLTVASERANCVGVGPQKCLIIKRAESNDWEFWYSGIEGFDYEPGYEYKIRVVKEKRDNPAADQSSIRYVLDKVISKERKLSENMPVIEDLPQLREEDFIL